MSFLLNFIFDVDLCKQVLYNVTTRVNALRCGGHIMKSISLTETEWSVMECLWEKAPRIGREII